MTFDSLEELKKIHSIFPKAELVIRIATDPSVTTAVYNLNEKFGISPDIVDEILIEAKRLRMKIRGVAFHTGSGGVTFKAYESSIVNAHRIFERAKELGLKQMDFLDIGGGFTMIHDQSDKNIQLVGPRINSLINRLFPDPAVKVIGEPGRFVCESAVYMASSIIG
jgi:ornithine decarboxylase